MFVRAGQLVSSVALIVLCLWLLADATLLERAPADLLGAFRVTPGRFPGLAFAPFPTRPPHYGGARLNALLKTQWQGAAAVLINVAFGRTAHEELEIRSSANSDHDPEKACQLSALYLGLVADGNEPLLNASRALTWAEVALRIQPNLAEAQFNRALALEGLFLVEDAVSAWRNYLKLDSKSPWAKEARHQLHILSIKPSYWREWRLARGLLVRGTYHNLSEIVRKFPQPTRLWIERALLIEWAHSHRDHDRTGRETRWINQALVVSGALAQETGDFMVLDSVQVIRDALAKGDIPRLDKLAEGELMLVSAIEQHELTTGCRAEDEQFRLSEKWLQAARSPMALWATFYRANCRYRKRDYYQAQEFLHKIDLACQMGRYRTICGRAQWLEGLMAFHQNRIGEAFAFYSRARGFLAQEKPFLAAIHLFQSEALLLWGERAHAWENLAVSLRDMETLPASENQRRQAILQGVARLAAMEGSIAAALKFEDAALKIAQVSPEGLDDALVLRERAEIHLRVGDVQEAMRDLQQAEEKLRGGGDNSTRSVWAEVQVLRGEIFPRIQRAKDCADQVQVLEETKNRVALPRAFLLLGRAYAREQNLHAAEKAWLQGLEELDQVQPSLEGRQESEFFDRRDTFLAELLPVQIRLDPSGALAFSSVERTRRRSSLRPLSPSSATFKELQSVLPPGHALLEYAVLPDQLLIWAIQRDRIIFRSVPVSARQLSFWTYQLREAQERDLLEALGKLYEILFEPVREGIPPGSTLLIVPDWHLYAVPFAALRDPRHGRFLVEDYLVTGLPDARSGLRKDLPRQRSGASFRSILVLGDPAFSKEEHPTLARLPQTAEEATTVWHFYAPTLSRLRLYEQATPSEFLQGLGNYQIIHYGGHAVAKSPDPALARLVLAPETGRSGDLSAHELYGRDFSGTRLVVLAACETAAADAWVPRGGLEGFVEPLLEGGVKNVLASLWRVDNDTTRQQVIEFHAELRRNGHPLQSLALVQRRGLLRGEPVRHWAAFAIFGPAS